MTALTAAVAAYASLAIAIHFDNGRYTPKALVLILAAVVFIWTGVARARQTSIDRAGAIRVLTLAVIALAIAGMSLRPLTYREGLWFVVLAKAAWFSMIGYVLAAGVVGEAQRRRTFGAVLGAALLLRFLVPAASPSPLIDVFVFSQESAQHLLEGKNPYDTPVTSPYEPGEDRLHLPSYTYPPATLYLQLAGYLFGDVRFASAAAESATVVLLFLLARRAGHARIAELVALLYVAHPRGPFIIEQSWTEVLVLPFFGITLLAATAQRAGVAAAAFGFMLSIKQSLLFFPLFAVLIERRWRYVAIAVLAGFLTLVPFLIWDAERLWTNGLTYHMANAFRPEALTIFAPIWRWIEPVRGWTLVIGLGSAAGAVLACRSLGPVRGCAWAAAAATITMFALGDKAWANYYYFAGGLVMFAIATESERIQRLNQ